MALYAGAGALDRLGGRVACRDTLEQRSASMKLMKYLIAAGIGGLAAHLALKYRPGARADEGLGSFGPDPLDDDAGAAPG